MLLNCDMGESFGVWTMGSDAAVMPHIDLASIACGFHAGSPTLMHETVSLAKQHGVTVGAHPAYPDLEGFGRRSLQISKAEVAAILYYQIGALEAVCQAHDMSLGYVKPHGALYNDMQNDLELFRTVIAVIAQLNHHRTKPLRLLTLAKIDNSGQQDVATEYQVPLWYEAFADRRYEADGRLRSRQHADAVLQDQQAILTQGQAFAGSTAIKAVDGSTLNISADTLCVHGDNPESIATVAALRRELDQLK